MNPLRRVWKLFFVGILLAGLFFVPHVSRGVGLSDLGSLTPAPFGGMIVVKIHCSCTSLSLSKFKVKKVETSWIIVGLPSPGSFIVNPLTSLYDQKAVEIGNWVVGLTYGGKIPCLVGKIPACIPVGYGAPVKMIGTSGSKSLFGF